MAAGRSIIEIILKGVDNASGAFKSAEKSSGKFLKNIGSLIKQAGVLSIGVAGVGIAMKKAFDLGRQGAVIQQTDESFGFLMQKVKAAPDLFEQLTTASKGTLSTFELQSSTMKLLAGAQGDLATQLANATPRLLEIAKASNKLNPTLGSTAFLYESIATGVKRAQPLILDNLGLTIKVGEANAALAIELGKSVDALTAEERSLAILNETMRAGDILIAQVGGSTDAATDIFDQLSTAIKESGDAFKKQLTPFIEKAAKAVLELITRTKVLKEALAEEEQGVRKSAGSYEEYSEKVNQAVFEALELEEAENNLSLASTLRREAVFRLMLAQIQMTEVEFEAGREVNENTEFNLQLIEAMRERATVTATAITNEAALAENTRLSAEAADKAAKANKEFLDAIDRSIESPLTGLIKDVQFFIATEGKFVGVLDRVETLMAESPEQGLKLAQEFLIAVVDTKEELGDISTEEAVKALEEVGFTIDEATDAISGTDGLQEALVGIDDINLELKSLKTAQQITEFMLQDLQKLSGTQWDIRVNVNGAGGFGGGGGGGGTPTQETSPVFETPTGGPQQTLGGGVTQNFNISDRFDLEEVVGEIATRVQEQ